MADCDKYLNWHNRVSDWMRNTSKSTNVLFLGYLYSCLLFIEFCFFFLCCTIFCFVFVKRLWFLFVSLLYVSLFGFPLECFYFLFKFLSRNAIIGAKSIFSIFFAENSRRSCTCAPPDQESSEEEEEEEVENWNEKTLRIQWWKLRIKKRRRIRKTMIER